LVLPHSGTLLRCCWRGFRVSQPCRPCNAHRFCRGVRPQSRHMPADFAKHCRVGCVPAFPKTRE
jgi:hypothetical protein